MSIGTAYPVVGSLTPYLPGIDPMFQAFDTSVIHGLVSVHGARIDFLAVASHQPGHGDFGRFLDECMASYETVGIWEIWNGSLASMLRRRGFRDVREDLDGDGDLIPGMRWDKAASA